MKGYIAGPMRGYPQFNFPAFDEAAARGRRLGFKIINPADLDRENGIDESETANIERSVAESIGLLRAFVKRDVDALLSLRAEDGDFIALLPGWNKSTGATAELYVARWLKLAVRDATDFTIIPTANGIPLREPGEFCIDGCGLV